MSFLELVEAALAEVENAGLRRRAREIEGPQGPRLMVDGRSVLSLCSNNYLGLANHPLLVAALRRGLEEDGTRLGRVAPHLREHAGPP
ncbi:MAG: hypothetical protein QM778_23920 [Myxococcales bacterium]